MTFMTDIVVPGLLGLLLVLELLPTFQPKFQQGDEPRRSLPVCWLCVVIIVAVLGILLVF